MIPVVKPVTAPARLRNQGAVATAALIAAYDESPERYRTGERNFEFDSSIYGHRTVKSALRRAQHDKCCFCESNLVAVSYGDVEHYRPKGGYYQTADDELGKPGYYWLAYEWSNLFFSCQICNQQFKKNFFPLADASRRATSHHDLIDAEETLLISPSETAIGEHIGFRNEFAFAIDDSVRALTTIESVGLNRAELAERRLDRLKGIEQGLKLLDFLEEKYPIDNRSEVEADLIRDLRNHLDGYITDESEYAAMARAAVGTA